MSEPLPFDGVSLLAQMRAWGRSLGFSQIGVAGIDLASAEPRLAAWLDNGFHGEMDYMAAHGMKRARPAELVPGTVSVITARLDYLPRATATGWQRIEWDRLGDPSAATVSIYARGRDYHKVLRKRLAQLAERIAEAIGPFGHRVFTDSAPVLEVELASRSGIGWRGKHTLVLSRDAGSMFFLGEIYIDLALEPSAPVSALAAVRAVSGIGMTASMPCSGRSRRIFSASFSPMRRRALYTDTSSIIESGRAR